MYMYLIPYLFHFAGPAWQLFFFLNRGCWQAKKKKKSSPSPERGPCYWADKQQKKNNTKKEKKIIKLKHIRILYTLLKHPGQRDPQKGPLGPTPFRVNEDPEISQLDAKYDPDLGQSDPIICQFATDFRVIVDPEWSLAPMDPFPGHGWPGCF